MFSIATMLPRPALSVARVSLAALMLLQVASRAASAATGETVASEKKASDPTLPRWLADVGARSYVSRDRIISVNAYGAKPEANFDSTAAIQRAIDFASGGGGGQVVFAPGTYQTGALFLKDNVDLHLAADVTLLGTNDETKYPRENTRVAGIEMAWPAALINVNDAHNVHLTGGGTIDGNGEMWWKKYSSMRKDYEKRGLRWAADYDCERVRLVVVWKSTDVTLAQVHLRRAGFWTVQVCYSDRVTVSGISIRDNAGPSTDGVDIDSASHVLVENCDIDNNDDCICLKSGRDADGMRVNRPAEYVLIRGNLTRRGGGIVSFGSETSGGIRHIVALDNRGIGTKEGARFKSARTRGGYIEDVIIRGMKMEDVPKPITFTLDWNPSYSYAKLPADASDLPPPLREIPEYWKVLAAPILPAERGFCEMKDILLENFEITGAQTILDAVGMKTKPLLDVTLKNVDANGAHAGRIEYARDWKMAQVNFRTPTGEPVKLVDTADVQLPATELAGETRAAAGK